MGKVVHTQLSCQPWAAAGAQQLLLCDNDRSALVSSWWLPLSRCCCQGGWVRVCAPVLGVRQCFGCFSLQNINVVEQEKIDKLMLEMDGTENKCK